MKSENSWKFKVFSENPENDITGYSRYLKLVFSGSVSFSVFSSVPVFGDFMYPVVLVIPVIAVFREKENYRVYAVSGFREILNNPDVVLVSVIAVSLL